MLTVCLLGPEQVFLLPFSVLQFLTMTITHGKYKKCQIVVYNLNTHCEETGIMLLTKVCLLVCLYSGSEIRVRLGSRLLTVSDVFSPHCGASLGHVHNPGAAEDAGNPGPLQGHRGHSAQVGHTSSDFHCLKTLMKPNCTPPCRWSSHQLCCYKAPGSWVQS